MKDVQFIIDRVKELAKEENISINKLLSNCQLNSNFITNLQRRGTIPSVESIAKIAHYFNVPIDFIIGNPPFECWEEINEYRGQFLNDLKFDYDQMEALKRSWKITIDNIYNLPLDQFVKFIGAVAEWVHARRDYLGIVDKNAFTISLTPAYKDFKKKYITEKNERDLIGYDEFAYSIHKLSKNLTNEDKQVLLNVTKMFHERRESEKEQKPSDGIDHE